MEMIINQTDIKSKVEEQESNLNNNIIENDNIVTEGLPLTPDDYEIPEDKSLAFDKETDQSFRKLAFDLKLTNKQVKSIGDWANNTSKNFIEKNKQSLEESYNNSLAQLESKWGKNFESNIVRTKDMVSKLDSLSEGFIDFLNETGVGNDIRLINTLYNLSQVISEDYFPPSSSKGGQIESYIGSIPVLNFPSMTNDK